MTSAMTRQFRFPANRYRPKMRWWLPGAFLNDEEIKREIEWLAEKGYGGATVGHSASDPTRLRPYRTGRRPLRSRR